MGGDLKGGFLKMTFSVIGLVILFAMFPYHHDRACGITDNYWGV
jgi:hypothetical protein